MNKKFQIFISSTYQDLKHERAAIFKRIIEFEQIPTGMEFFPATDIDPLQNIKKVIDNCDYYILIVAGRYGSIDKDGVSFTEKEFDYAIGKGIPIFIFLHDNIKKLPVRKIETDNKTRDKLLRFRQRLEANFDCYYWSTEQELEGSIIVNLSKAIANDTRPSWEKINLEPNEELLMQIQNLQQELDDLNLQNKSFKEELESMQLRKPFDFSQEQLLLHGLVQHKSSQEGELWSIKTTWGEIFLAWAPYLLGWTDMSTAFKTLNQAIAASSEEYTYYLNKNLFQKIKVRFWDCGLIKINPSSGFIRLSIVGESYLSNEIS